MVAALHQSFHKKTFKTVAGASLTDPVSGSPSTLSTDILITLFSRISTQGKLVLFSRYHNINYAEVQVQTVQLQLLQQAPFTVKIFIRMMCLNKAAIVRRLSSPF